MMGSLNLDEDEYKNVLQDIDISKPENDDERVAEKYLAEQEAMLTCGFKTVEAVLQDINLPYQQRLYRPAVRQYDDLCSDVNTYGYQGKARVFAILMLAASRDSSQTMTKQSFEDILEKAIGETSSDQE